MSPDGEVVDTFSLLVPGQTIDKFRDVIKSHASGKTTSPPKPVPSPENKKATFRVFGMKKTASGAT